MIQTAERIPKKNFLPLSSLARLLALGLLLNLECGQIGPHNLPLLFCLPRITRDSKLFIKALENRLLLSRGLILVPGGHCFSLCCVQLFNLRPK